MQPPAAGVGIRRPRGSEGRTGARPSSPSMAGGVSVGCCEELVAGEGATSIPAARVGQRIDDMDCPGALAPLVVRLDQLVVEDTRPVDRVGAAHGRPEPLTIKMVLRSRWRKVFPTAAEGSAPGTSV